jgi:hypothetical protein
MHKIWGTYPWFNEYGDELIYPDDRELFKKIENNTKVFEFTKGNDEYNNFRYGENIFRIKDTIPVVLPEPKYNFGEDVLVKKKALLVGKITDIMWHSSKKEYYYLLSVNGKKKSTRYFENELEKNN